VQQVQIRATPLEELGALLTAARRQEFLAIASRARDLLADRVVWNVNTTAHGGGVAEMLQTLLAYGRAAGVDTRWLVLDAPPEFFTVTKRLHNALHGVLDRPFDDADHRIFQQVSQANAAELRELVRPGDIVLLHDPQTAGLAAAMRDRSTHVVWRSHIGRDRPNAGTEQGWQFLRGYLGSPHAFVFSRAQYPPDWLPADRVRVIPPSIDPVAVKNRPLAADQVLRVLRRVGLLGGPADPAPIRFARRDGGSALLVPRTGLLDGPPPPAEAQLVVQVSRWDRLKDMAGVLTAFADRVAPRLPDAHLLLAGPEVTGVADDPEAAGVLAECQALRELLPPPVRGRCHLASLPMDDPDQNALIVNGLQQHAAVVVQKSLVEGFGLTVTEAMWKARPVLAGAVGGIADQITDGVDGLLVADPSDLAGFGDRLYGLLTDARLRDRLGPAGQDRVRAAYLGDRHLIQWVAVFEELLERPGW